MGCRREDPYPRNYQIVRLGTGLMGGMEIVENKMWCRRQKNTYVSSDAR